jgi:DNA-binding beta-propeller fold protein YncE
VADIVSDDVKRVRASDGSVLGTWTGATEPFGVLVARGRVYVTGIASPGHLYVINPANGPGPITTLSFLLGAFPQGIATDGTFVWTANSDPPGSVSKVDPDTGTPTNSTTGFSQPIGIIFDGANLWVTDAGDKTLKKLDPNSNAMVLQSVPVGNNPQFPVFDGSNIWVPNANDNSVTVVRARDGMVLATLTGNGLNQPNQAAFDGQRILVTNPTGNSVSLWKASDLTPIRSVSAGATNPFGACSDGINFWITLEAAGQLARL